MSKIENCYYVYLYIDPRNKEVFYVGKGKRYRDTEHLRSVINDNMRESGNMRKYSRIKDIISSGLMPHISRYKENLTDNTAHAIEAELISKYGILEDGGTLLNLYRSYNLTETDRVNISNSLKKYYQLNDVWNKGKRFSDKTRRKQSDARRRFFTNGGQIHNKKLWITPVGEYLSRLEASKATGLTPKQLQKRCGLRNGVAITKHAAVQIKDFNAFPFIGKTWKELGYGLTQPPAMVT